MDKSLHWQSLDGQLGGFISLGGNLGLLLSRFGFPILQLGH